MQSVKLVQTLLVVCVVTFTHLQEVRLESDEDEAKGGAHIIYDQRQSGKYNIHVVIKDVAIIEMDQNEIEDTNYNDEEYYYDENDLTVKPITLNPTTPTTKLPSTTSTTTIAPTKKINTTINKVTETKYPATENDQDETATFTSAMLWNTLSSLISKKPPGEEVVSTEIPTQHSSAQTTQEYLTDKLNVKPRSKVEPIYAIEEEPLQMRSREDSIPLEQGAKTLTNSKIYKVKVHRSHQPHHYAPLKIQSRRCRSNQYRDLSGNCRIKRSPAGSLL